ncbi:hypothetical protein FG386_002492 [Cryptosporidium ryanae]|uniref:uncharacterized protein n=1 Tax=Cryptosporidium ryanae TaxID=515981 RepID=UPI003519FA57|nr:hypothetical protein FG386_002492 [Cryptosporidium ryanae]
MKYKLSLAGLTSTILLCLSSYILMDYISLMKVEAAGAIPKLLKRNSRSYNLKNDNSDDDLSSVPQERRCNHLGEQIAKKNRVLREFKRLFACLKDFDSRKYLSIHDKNMEVSKKCARYGIKIAEYVKRPTLDCIFCFKEIVTELIKESEEIKELLNTQSMTSTAYLYTLIIFEEKYIRQEISQIAESVSDKMWFKAYSDSREFCRIIAIIYHFWNRVVRDTIWPYIIFGSNNYLSRFTIEYGKFKVIINK